MSVMRNKDQIYDPWSSRRMELWGQLTNGLYSFKFDVERIAPMAVRGIVFKPRASPVPGLTALPSFRAGQSASAMLPPPPLQEPS